MTSKNDMTKFYPTYFFVSVWSFSFTIFSWRPSVPSRIRWQSCRKLWNSDCSPREGRSGVCCWEVGYIKVVWTRRQQEDIPCRRTCWHGKLSYWTLLVTYKWIRVGMEYNYVWKTLFSKSVLFEYTLVPIHYHHNRTIMLIMQYWFPTTSYTSMKGPVPDQGAINVQIKKNWRKT